jgi:hypothetical protein
MCYSRNVQIHRLVTLLSCTVFHESRASALDLNSAASLLLNMLHICTTVAHNLSSEVKTRNRFKINRDLFLRPFSLLELV